MALFSLNVQGKKSLSGCADYNVVEMRFTHEEEILFSQSVLLLH